MWIGLGILGLEYWLPVSLAALALGAVAWLGRSLPKPLRWSAGILAVLCVAPLALGLELAGGDIVGQAQRAAEERARHRTLVAAETVAGLPLPAGAVLAYSDKTHRILTSVALPGPVTVVGLALAGELEPITAAEWSGVLAKDQTIGDWPCRAGDIWFTPAGEITRCVLATGQRLAGYDLPAGAESRRNPSTGGYEFRLSQQGPALPLPALGAELPAGGTLTLAADGKLRRLYAPHETRVTIAGIALFDDIVLDDTGATGELAEARKVDSIELPAEAEVRVDISTGRTALAARPSIDAP